MMQRWTGFVCRTVRETTPCSMIRNSESIRTPGSTTRPTNSTASSRRMQSWMHSNIPTSHEMEEFFSGAEQMQQRMFAEKYVPFSPSNVSFLLAHIRTSLSRTTRIKICMSSFLNANLKLTIAGITSIPSMIFHFPAAMNG